MNDSVDTRNGSFLYQFSTEYAKYHGYLSLVVCFFGIVTNIINITVLTRKHMRTPVNLILTSLAVADILTMASYLPFSWHFYCKYPNPNPHRNTFGWMQFLIFHINFTTTTHTVSVWLGVLLAIFRYRHIQSPAKGNLTRMRRIIRARISVCLTYVSAALLLVPNYISYDLILKDESYYVLKSIKANTDRSFLVNLWLYSILAKLLPCILMIVYGGLLLRTLKAKLKNKRRLSSLAPANSQPRILDHSRTTRMLLVVVILFIVTELPQAILLILSATLERFFGDYYTPLGDLMDIVALINNAINFVLYCSMSQEYRRTLMQIYCSVLSTQRSIVTLDMAPELITNTRINLR
ncbi:sex peptide receptor [Octopus sinensis]|uniref:Sex peptide receptor n=1 Tax=Octopus sinensis TaxID=2607531 RepID=A0A6P7TQD1_9MOLL|nr:sex peptide receptor [Octopus sinensis]